MTPKTHNWESGKKVREARQGLASFWAVKKGN